MRKIVFIIVLTVFGTNLTTAQITKVDQEVFGMDCAPCAYGLERGLKKMDGVKNVKVSLNEGKAFLDLTANNSLGLKQIQEEVKSNGFSAKKAIITVQGELTKMGNQWVLKTKDETFSISQNTTGGLFKNLSVGKTTLKGTVMDEEDKNLDNSWKLQISDML